MGVILLGFLILLLSIVLVLRFWIGVVIVLVMRFLRWLSFGMVNLVFFFLMMLIYFWIVMLILVFVVMLVFVVFIDDDYYCWNFCWVDEGFLRCSFVGLVFVWWVWFWSLFLVWIDFYCFVNGCDVVEYEDGFGVEEVGFYVF